MKSIRSIQSQTLKNIEIIIENDCSIDKTKQYYNNLRENDLRVGIFNHIKNLGVWMSRFDGF